MALIALEGMRFHAFHGVYEAERKLGTEYVVDVYVKAGIAKAVATDDVEHAVNYETIYQLCRLEMREPHNLIEKVLAGIVDRMQRQFPTMEGLRVRVRKEHPPMGARVESSYVESNQDYVSECPRCKKKFISYNQEDCFLRWPNLHPATREMLAKQFGPRCLCDDCLKFYAG